jgi:hypothetical protein
LHNTRYLFIHSLLMAGTGALSCMERKIEMFSFLFRRQND